MHDNSIIAIIGNIDNTLLVNDLCVRARNKEIVMINDTNPYSSTIIQEIFKTQLECCRDNYLDANGITLVIDISTDTNWLKEESIKTLFYYSNSYKITFIFTLKDSTINIHPSLRANIDYTFISNDSNTHANINILYNNYAGIFETINEFKNLIKQCSPTDYLVIDNVNNNGFIHH